MPRLSLLRAETGFTIIEVMVAALILVVGVSGTLALVDGANSATSSAKEVEGATNLAREITEQTRSLSYGSVTPAGLASQLQLSSPDLASTSAPPKWTVVRRGIVFEVNVAVCSIDDPKDGAASPTAATFCPNLGPKSTPATDTIPEDFKRVSVTVSWQRGDAARRTVRQVITLSPRGADGPGVGSLVATSPTFPNPSAPVVGSTAVTSVTFKATTDARATSVIYSVDGVDRGTATRSGSDWVFTLNISGWTDRSYEIGVRAQANAISGNTYLAPLVLNRYPAAAPSGVQAGLSSTYVSGSQTSVTELTWLANSEANVIGYRVYRPGDTTPVNCGSPALDARRTTCTDFSPVAGAYTVVAVYKDAAGVERESAGTTVSVSSSSAKTFYFKNANANTAGAGCPGTTAKRDMEEGFAGGTDAFLDTATAGATPWRFCSPPVTAGTTYAGGTGKIVAHFDNSANKSCAVTPAATVNGSASLGTITAKTVPASSAVARYEWTFSMSAPAIAAGDQINASFSAPGSDCAGTSLHYSGTTTRSLMELPISGYNRPSPPSGVSSAASPDGLRLSWQAPATGPTPAFYRIYRDGYNYANRYDRTGDSSTFYVDPDRTPGSHTYYVTSVTAALGESAPAALPPATFP